MRKIIIGFVLGIFISLIFIAATSTQIHYAGFESGIQGWTDGGTDSARSVARSNVTDTGTPGGIWSWNLQDDTTTSNIEQSFDFTGYDLINITWSAYYASIELNEALELRCDGSILWHYEANTEGTEDLWLGIDEKQYVTIYPSNCTFDSSVTIRFESEFSANNDDVYIDGINITGITLGESINPNLTINQPLNQTYTTTTIDFNVTALDETEMSDVYYTLNGGAR